MSRDLNGMCLYIKARDERAEEARKLLAETAAKELKGELPKAFRDEAEAAEAGMGGDVWVYSRYKIINSIAWPHSSRARLPFQLHIGPGALL
jgi:hypothetical protein